MKLSDYVMQFVAKLGVKQVFFVPGGGAMHLNDSLARSPDIKFVCNQHEQASAIAADAYAKVSNGFGVAMVTSGPGGTNALTGVVAAWLDSTPCLFLSGQVKRPDLKGTTGTRQLGMQEVDIVSIVGPVTKYAVTVLDPDSIRYQLEKAACLAASGRQGPVWIDIPLDVQAATIDPAQLKGFEPGESGARTEGGLPAQVAGAIELLNKSARPVLLAGNGIRLAQADDNFLKFVDLLGIPVLTTWLSLDLIPECHKLYVGRPGGIAPRGANFALQNSDLLLVLGSRLDAGLTGYAHANLARGARKIMVDVDPAEIAKMKTRIDLPICCDAGTFMNEIFRQAPAVKAVSRCEWLDRCGQWKTRYPVVQPEHRREDLGLSTYYFSEMLAEELPDTAVIASGSSGFGVEIFLLVVKVKQGQRIFHARGLGAMGFGVPAAVGACFAGGSRPTICVEGDGSLQMNVQELATVAEHNLPIKFFIINNRGYASIRSSQSNYFKLLAGADASSGLTLPDTCKLAEAYGLRSARIETPKDLRQQIRKVLDSPGPVLCDVVVIPDEARAPKLASVQRPDGSMFSRPLEDLWPFLERDEFHSNMLIPPVDEQ